MEELSNIIFYKIRGRFAVNGELLLEKILER